MIAIVLVFKIFPECFIKNQGQTNFKIISEIIIIFILTLVLYCLRYNKDKFNYKTYKSLIISVLLTIISEIFFTIYIDNYSISNIIGHYFKIISFYLIYKSIIEVGIKEPYEIIFNNLETKKKELELSNTEKTKLFSIIAHDLKSPFNGLINFSELLIEDYENMNENEKKEYISIIHKSSKICII